VEEPAFPRPARGGSPRLALILFRTPHLLSGALVGRAPERLRRRGIDDDKQATDGSDAIHCR
jgi:hypothetical protein